jgi:hypothetical protein
MALMAEAMQAGARQERACTAFASASVPCSAGSAASAVPRG